MKKKDTNDIHVKTQEELKKMLDEARHDLVGFQLEQAQRKLKNTKSLATKKDDIARLLTVMREKEIADRLAASSKKTEGKGK